MDQLVSSFYRLLSLLAGLALIAAFGAVCLGILARQFDWDLPGLDAYAGFSIAAALFLALPDTFRRGDHLRVSLLVNRLSVRAREALEYLCLGAGLALSTYFCWFAARLVWTSYLMNDVSPAADATPLWIPQSLMALGAFGFCLAFAEALLAKLRSQPQFAASNDAEIARAE
ncbi:hypothetical protein BURK2_04542 [Burkholderiales bacterium]|nr:MAG: TRAP transporter small permease [Burkholderiales bacterium]CAG1012546.1 hypothetical protein BURK2_04542 [Burkholderiales bacterium]